MVTRIPVGKHRELEFVARNDELIVRISSEAVRKLLAQASRGYPDETGGVLVGYYDTSLHRAIVTGIGPCPRDSVKRTGFFVRGTRGLSPFLRRLWRGTDGMRHYLGEWHTHPNGIAESSYVDRKTMWAVANDEKTLCPEPILVILAGSLKNAAEVGVFLYPRGHREIRLVLSPDGSFERLGAGI